MRATFLALIFDIFIQQHRRGHQDPRHRPNGQQWRRSGGGGSPAAACSAPGDAGVSEDGRGDDAAAAAGDGGNGGGEAAVRDGLDAPHQVRHQVQEAEQHEVVCTPLLISLDPISMPYW